MKEYRIQSRYGEEPWRDHEPTYTGERARTIAIREWVRWSAQGIPNWTYRIMEREVSEWEPIKRMDEALAILAEDAGS